MLRSSSKLCGCISITLHLIVVILTLLLVVSFLLTITPPVSAAHIAHASPPTGGSSSSSSSSSGKAVQGQFYPRPTSITRRVSTDPSSVKGVPGQVGNVDERGDDSSQMFFPGNREQLLMSYRAQLGGINATMYQWETVLLQYLFSDSHYNPEARPAIHVKMPVHVRLDMVLLKINELVEKDQEIIVSGFLKINWTDDRLTWNKNDFGGIEWMVTQAPNVWIPDIALINSNDVYAVTRDSRFPVTVTSSGQVLFVPAGKIHARCELDLRFFPFDWQVCYYRFESWVYSAESVAISGYNFTIDPNHYVQNHQWDILDSFVLSKSVKYESFNFSRVDFYLLLKRKSLFFITYTIFPCLALSTLQIFSHMLPFTESERINFATTTLIAFSVFHVSIVEQMPQSSESIPLLAIYVDSLMILIGLSLIECFVMMNWLSKIAFTVPSPIMWYYVVERWGDHMFLGSAGTFWRRNYLKIYGRVVARLDVLADKRRLRRLLIEQLAESNREKMNKVPSSLLDELLSKRCYSKYERTVIEQMAHRWHYTSTWLLEKDNTMSPEKTQDTLNTNADNNSDRKSNRKMYEPPSPVTVMRQLKTRQQQQLHQYSEPLLSGGVDAQEVARALNRSTGTCCGRHPSNISTNKPKSIAMTTRLASTTSDNNNNYNRMEDADFATALTTNSPSLFSSLASEYGQAPPLPAAICNKETMLTDISHSQTYDNNIDPAKVDPLELLDYMANRQPLMSTSPVRMCDIEEMRAVQSECGSVRKQQQQQQQQPKQKQKKKQSRHSKCEEDDDKDSLLHNHPRHNMMVEEATDVWSPMMTRQSERSPSSISSATATSLRINRFGAITDSSLSGNYPRQRLSSCRRSDAIGDANLVENLTSPVFDNLSPMSPHRPYHHHHKHCHKHHRKSDTESTQRLIVGDVTSAAAAAAASPNNNNSNKNKIDNNCDNAHRHYAEALTLALTQIHENVGDVSMAVTSQELKRECIGIWTIFITVIDRIMSLLLLLLCIAMPTYLFLLFPRPIDISNLKAEQQSQS